MKMMLAIGILFCASWVFAGGPIYQHKDSFTQQEFENTYKDVRSPAIGVGTASTMTITTVTGSSLTFTNGTINTLRVTSLSGVSVGKVLQVVQSSCTVNFNTTSNTFQDTNLVGAITPSSTSSRILILAVGVLWADAANTRAIATIARDTTNLMGSNGQCQQYTNTDTVSASPCTMVYVDSPATTSLTPYRVQLKSSIGGNIVEWNDGTSYTQIMVLVEIGP